MKINTDILPKWWSIFVWIVILLSLQGCYTQLAMFHPEPEVEEEQFYETYSKAVPRPNISLQAQTGAGTSLGIAYSTMYNRFYGMYTNWGSYYGSGYYNKYDYYNRYGYQWGYDSYNIGGYKMFIPNTDEKKPRTWSRDTKSSTTNLNITRTRSSDTSQSNNNGGYSNSSNVSVTRGTSSSSSNNSGGRRATRRN